MLERLAAIKAQKALSENANDVLIVCIIGRLNLIASSFFDCWNINTVTLLQQCARLQEFSLSPCEFALSSCKFAGARVHACEERTLQCKRWKRLYCFEPSEQWTVWLCAGWRGLGCSASVQMRRFARNAHEVCQHAVKHVADINVLKAFSFQKRVAVMLVVFAVSYAVKVRLQIYSRCVLCIGKQDICVSMLNFLQRPFQ